MDGILPPTENTAVYQINERLDYCLTYYIGLTGTESCNLSAIQVDPYVPNVDILAMPDDMRPLKGPKRRRPVMSAWTRRCPHPAASLLPRARVAREARPLIGRGHQETGSAPSSARSSLSTANTRYPRLGVTLWPRGKVGPNLLVSLPRWKVQSRQIFLETRTEGIGARMAAYKLVLIRHGESCWNQENRFCGWYDADLSGTGEHEAKRGGQALKGDRLRTGPAAAFCPLLD